LKSYYDVVIEGSEEHVRGFVEGLASFQNLDEETLIIPEDHIGKWTTLDYVRKILQLKKGAVHLIVENTLLNALTGAISSGKRPVSMKILSAKPIRGASFDFSLKAFSRDISEKIKKSVSNLPEGVQVKFSQWDEKARPESEGIEAYAPEHGYELHASGHMQGPPEEVIRLYEKMETNEMFELDLIQLDYGDPIPL
jgi:hypothetical protein